MAEPAPPNARDHLANERTLLAWIRTAVTVVGLGFVIDRLAVQGQANDFETWAGIAIVLFGCVLAVLGGYSYLRAERELTAGSYRPAVALNVLLVAAVALLSAGVAVLLVLR
jgi:inner membrane protein YidH